MLTLENMARPPGLVGDIAEWINETAGKPQPILALAASLTYVGALGGRIYQGPCGERTNLYCLGVAESCSGKEHARTQIKKLNRAAGVLNLMGGEDVTSDAAIEMELVRQSRVLYLWDEIGHMFGNIRNSIGNGHRQNIIPMLMKLYSCADKTYEGKSYADRDGSKARRAVEQPCLCLYGTTVPERLYAALDKGQLLDGFLSRCLLFETKDNPPFDRRRAMVRDMPDDLIERVADLGRLSPTMKGDGQDGDIISAQTVDPQVIGFTDPAFEMACQMDEVFQHMAEEERKKGSGFQSLYARHCQNSTKVALVVAIGCRSSVIDLEMLSWASELVGRINKHIIETVKGQVADNENERARKRILSCIRECGKNGASITQITRKTADLKARDRNDLLKELENDFGLIASENNEGKRGRRYWDIKWCAAEAHDA